jgi:hypothetical protein
MYPSYNCTPILKPMVIYKGNYYILYLIYEGNKMFFDKWVSYTNIYSKSKNEKIAYG